MGKTPMYANTEKLKVHIGKKPVEHILTQVKEGFFLEDESVKFAFHLHPEAHGSFIHSNIAYGEGKMVLIFSEWFEKEVFGQTKEQAIFKLENALKKAGKTEIVHEIQKMCPKKVQDTTYSAASEIEEKQPFLSENNVSRTNGRWGSWVFCGTQIPGKWITGVFSSLVFVCLLCGLVCLTVTKFSATNSPARSIRFKKGVVVDEFLTCPRNQSSIPPFSPEGSNVVDGSVGIYTDELGFLLCGGTDERDHNAKQCYTHVLGAHSWELFEHELNENRVDSHITRGGNKICIIGGESSNPNQNCYNSYETLDLDNRSAGWQKAETKIKNVQTQCFKSAFLMIDNIPCK